MPFLTVIIPTYNEEHTLSDLLKDLFAQKWIELQIIVCDGGSTDKTSLLGKTPGIEYIISPKKNRAAQMNYGSQYAQSDTLLFLHSDSRVPNSHTLINAYNYWSKQNDNQCAGHFGLVFQRTHPSRHNFFWRVAQEKTYSNRPDTINGDQGLLIRKTFFESLGGFDESLHFLEDQKIAHKIFKEGKWILLPGYIITSARRFEAEGTIRLYILMALIMGLYKTDFPDFLTKAPQLYKTQSKTQKIKLTSFLKLIWQIKRHQLGFKKSIIAWYRVGGYIQSHAWQLFYLFDHLLRFPFYLGKKLFPMLWLYDHLLKYIARNSMIRSIIALTCFFWVYCGLLPFFWVKESFEN